jgi:putative transposase
VAVLVTAASVQDRAAVPRLLGRARYRCPGARHLWAEQGYTGSVVQAVSRILRFTIQIVGGINLKGGFITQPRRWVVERTFAWMHRCRRLTASTSRPYWPMKPWSSSASSRSCSAA